jgi:hypothetical protein
MNFQKSAKTTTTRSFRYYSYESMTLQLGPCLESNSCMQSLTGNKTGRSSGARCFGRWGPCRRRGSGGGAPGSRRERVGLLLSARGGLCWPGHASPRLGGGAPWQGRARRWQSDDRCWLRLARLPARLLTSAARPGVASGLLAA